MQRGGGGGGGGGGGRGGPAAPPNPQTSGVWRSNDKGRTWTFMSNENQRPMYFQPDSRRSEQPGRSSTSAASVRRSRSMAARRGTASNNMGHVDNHAIWIDPLNSKHVMYGNDGGVDVSWDAGAKWEAVRIVGRRARLSRVGRHAASVQRLHRSAGQRLVVRTELRARERRHPAMDVDSSRRR